jgi:hypothetical protein
VVLPASAIVSMIVAAGWYCAHEAPGATGAISDGGVDGLGVVAPT